jgi:acetolactate synthase-1/2/3 large subunit
VVVDNGGYGEIRDQMRDRGDEPVAVDLAGPDWAQLGRAYRLDVVVIDATSDDPACAEPLSAAVTAGLASERPTLVVVPEGGAR